MNETVNETVTTPSLDNPPEITSISPTTTITSKTSVVHSTLPCATKSPTDDNSAIKPFTGKECELVSVTCDDAATIPVISSDSSDPETPKSGESNYFWDTYTKHPILDRSLPDKSDADDKDFESPDEEEEEEEEEDVDDLITQEELDALRIDQRVSRFVCRSAHADENVVPI